MGTNRVGQFMRMVAVFALAVCAGCASGNVSPASVSPSADSSEAVSIAKPSPSTTGASSSSSNAGTLASYTRAEAFGQNGSLAIVPEEGETSFNVDAASCYSKEGDVDFKGDYHAVFTDKKGNTPQDLGAIGNQIQTETTQQLAISNVVINDADVFFFNLQNNSCYGSVYYFYGAGKDGKAFPISFDMGNEDGIYDHFTLYLDHAPAASEDGTILLDGYGQGGNMPPDLVRYEFKLQNDKFILVKKAFPETDPL